MKNTVRPEKSQRLKMVRALARAHKESIKNPAPSFISRRDEFLHKFVDSRVPNWGGIKLSMWRSIRA